ncbi:MAG TPA: hypothetical protein VLR51_05060, partial [Actinomycetes bacterium]|nr:hypothetical protein [Actinomycetes bacterium]
MTAILAMATPLRMNRTSFSVEHTMSELAELPILAFSLDAMVLGRGIVRVRAGLTALATVVVVAAVGCTSGNDGGAASQAAATSTTVHHTTTPA